MRRKRKSAEPDLPFNDPEAWTDDDWEEWAERDREDDIEDAAVVVGPKEWEGRT